MSFAHRLEAAKSFELEVEHYLSTRGGMVAKNGTEHTHPAFTKNIRFNADPGAKFVRFAPDGVYLSTSGSVIHWEAKAGKNVEKDAYETYMAYHKMGCTVVLFVRSRGVYYGLIESIRFVPSEDVVGQYAEDRRHPICEHGWIHPRRGHGYAGSGSGTPYKEIEIGSLCLLSDFDAARAAALPAEATQ